MARQPRFHADADRRLYLTCLRQAASRHDCAIHAYVLMPNHVHLLITPAKAGAVARMMQALGRRHVRLFNDIHARSGTLWEGRYKSSPVDSETYLFTCHRYIELNPVRAGLVDNPLDYPWSSHSHYRLSRADEPGRREAFEALFRERLGDQSLQQIRKSANDRIETVLGRSARPQSVAGHSNRSKGRRGLPAPKC
jgi:REP element-mobilizing transposase RayT